MGKGQQLPQREEHMVPSYQPSLWNQVTVLENENLAAAVHTQIIRLMNYRSIAI